jgi:hypothetical protein
LIVVIPVALLVNLFYPVAACARNANNATAGGGAHFAALAIRGIGSVALLFHFFHIIAACVRGYFLWNANAFCQIAFPVHAIYFPAVVGAGQKRRVNKIVKPG